jgi:hypothetical protein
MDSKDIDALSLSEKAKAALRQAARKVAEEAKRTGGTVVVWQDGQVREIPGNQLPNMPTSPACGT